MGRIIEGMSSSTEPNPPAGVIDPSVGPHIQTSTGRDSALDTLRGLAMMYVIFIHTLFWTPWFKDGAITIIKSFFLIEMPLFFFLAGAANALGRKKSLARFYVSRCQRILVPYWFYAILCLALTAAISFQTFRDMAPARVILGWLLPLDQPSAVPYLSWALWFVPIYLLVIVCFPALRWTFDHTAGLTRWALPVLLAVAVLVLSRTFPYTSDSPKFGAAFCMKHVTTTVFYCFWVYLGLFFQSWRQENRTRWKTAAILAGVCFAAVAALLLTRRYVPDMQENKFPPNFIFLLYTFGMLSLVYAGHNTILAAIAQLRRWAAIDWLFEQYSRRCYTIYLYHPVVFLIILKTLAWLPFHVAGWIEFPVTLLAALVLSVLLGKLFHFAEKITLIPDGNK